MEALIVRVGARGGRGATYHRFDGATLAIGRGPRNAVIVDDPYIGPEQFLLHRGEGGVELEVRDRTNPVFLNRRHLTGARHALAVGDRVESGHTVLTLLSEASAVEPARVLSFSLWSRLGGWQPVIAIAMLLLTFGAMYVAGYLDTYRKPDWGKLASAPLTLSLVLLGWSAFWAIVGRLLRNQPQFFSHLFVTAAVTLLTAQVSVIAEYGAYASGVTRVFEVFDWIGEALLSTVLLFFNLRLATHLRRPALAAALCIGVIVALASAVDYMEREEFDPAPEVETLLKPPSAKFRAGENFDDYAKSLESLFAELRDDDGDAEADAGPPPAPVADGGAS